MNKKFEAIFDKINPIITKISSNKFLTGLSGGMMATLPITVVGYFANGYDAYIYNPPEGSNDQKALLGIIERPSTPTSITLQVPTINVPDTSSTSFLVYGIGTLIIIAGIVLIVVAKRPKNAKKK